jgi:hypothetical protein
MIAYDFLKHITSLALVSIGGILALLQASGQKPDSGALLSIALIGGAAVLGTIVLAGFTVAEVTGKITETAPKGLARSLQLVAGLLLMGLGIFVGAYVGKIG